MREFAEGDETGVVRDEGEAVTDLSPTLYIYSEERGKDFCMYKIPPHNPCGIAPFPLCVLQDM